MFDHSMRLRNSLRRFPLTLLIVAQLGVLSSATGVPIIVSAEADLAINANGWQQLKVTFDERVDSDPWIVLDPFNYRIVLPNDSSYVNEAVSVSSLTSDPYSVILQLIGFYSGLLQPETTYELLFPVYLPEQQMFLFRTPGSGSGSAVPDGGSTICLLAASIMGLISAGRRWRK